MDFHTRSSFHPITRDQQDADSLSSEIDTPLTRHKQLNRPMGSTESLVTREIRAHEQRKITDIYAKPTPRRRGAILDPPTIPPHTNIPSHINSNLPNHLSNTHYPSSSTSLPSHIGTNGWPPSTISAQMHVEADIDGSTVSVL